MQKQLTDAYILYFKELLSNNSRIFANAIGIGKTQAILIIIISYILLKARERSTARAKEASPLTLNLNNNSPLENIGRLTKEKVIKMRINTTNAIFKALAAANKLVAL
ncbi:hypothetical protein HBH47_122690 [Parastagonospora nodorum]|nr:hypothetical protein HBH47_122690 [Parastagonospora nodorum]